MGQVANGEVKDELLKALDATLKARVLEWVFDPDLIPDNLFSFSVTKNDGVIKITPNTPYDNYHLAKRAIGEFSRDLRCGTGCITFTDRIAGKANTGNKIGTFRADYTLGGTHFYTARSWEDMVNGLNTLLLNLVKNEALQRC